MRKRNTSGPQRSRKDSSGPSTNRKRSAAPFKKSGTGFRKRSEDESSEEKDRPGASAKRSYTPRGESSSSRSYKSKTDNPTDKKSQFGKRDVKSSDRKKPFLDRTDNRESGKGKSTFPGKRSFSKEEPRPYKKRESTSAKPSARATSNRYDKPKDESRSRGKRESTFPGKRNFSSDEERPYKKRESSSFSRTERNDATTPSRRFDKQKDESRTEKKPRSRFDKSDSKDKSFERAPRPNAGDRERRPYKSDRRTDKPSRSKSAEKFNDAPGRIEKIRLNRYIANSGVCSRREADELITMGLITVNGKSVTELGYKVNPGDEVRHEGRLLKAEKPVYILMNKPKGFLTTTNDPQERSTVMQIIGNSVKERIYPVGRLDRNTTGLLLLTNDGDLADKLMHPSYNAKKIYKVELDRPFTKADFQRVQEGIKLEEGVAQVDDLAIISEDGKTVGVELHIGWNRVVRRIFEALEYDVVKLDRSVYAGLDKKDLPRGHWRFLTKEEIVHLKHYK